MRDLAFYNVECRGPGLKGRLLGPVRRAIRRVLRPIFHRQMGLLEELHRRDDDGDRALAETRADFARQFVETRAEIAHRNEDALRLIRDQNAQIHHLVLEIRDLRRRVDTAHALAWDHAALVTRLASIEDHVDALMPPDGPTLSGARPGPTIYFPGLRDDMEQALNRVS